MYVYTYNLKLQILEFLSFPVPTLYVYISGFPIVSSERDRGRSPLLIKILTNPSSLKFCPPYKCSPQLNMESPLTNISGPHFLLRSLCQPSISTTNRT